MTFSDAYLNYLNVLQDVGMTSIEPIQFKGQAIAPLEFLKEVLPNPAEISTNYSGKPALAASLQVKKMAKN